MPRLEQSGGGAAHGHDWLVERAAPIAGVRLLRAQLRDSAFSRHRHDTYTVSVTERGVQEFTYRGSVHRSLPGQVVILHPDEPHDGRPATSEGFVFRSVYIEPPVVTDALVRWQECDHGLPFASTPIVSDPVLARRLLHASNACLEPLEADDLLHAICDGLLRHGRPRMSNTRRKGVSAIALARACEYLNENCRRSVGAQELEAVCGESRYNIADAFRRRMGTSPHRYLLMRRMEHVRRKLATAPTLAGLALEAGFADQAHMTRQFKATFGLTPAAYARLHGASHGPEGRSGHRPGS